MISILVVGIFRLMDAQMDHLADIIICRVEDGYRVDGYSCIVRVILVLRLISHPRWYETSYNYFTN